MLEVEFGQAGVPPTYVQDQGGGNREAASRMEYDRDRSCIRDAFISYLQLCLSQTGPIVFYGNGDLGTCHSVARTPVEYPGGMRG